MAVLRVRAEQEPHPPIFPESGGRATVYERDGDLRELLARVKAEIGEVGAAEARARQGRRSSSTCANATSGRKASSRRRPHSARQPRVADRGARPRPRARARLYCSGGSRSAFAAKALQELGYENVTSLTGGFTDWKRNGFPIETPRSLSPDQRRRYSRHLLIPEVGEAGQERLLGGRVLLIGAGGLGSPRRSTSPRPASGRSGSSTRTSSTTRTCSARSSTRPRRSARPRCSRRSGRSRRSTRTSSSRPTRSG